MYLYVCRAVTVSEVEKVTRVGVQDFDEVVERFSLGGEESCGACHVVLARLLAEIAPVPLAQGQKECASECIDCPLRAACARGLGQGEVR